MIRKIAIILSLISADLVAEVPMYTNMSVAMQEICNNGVDDDGDGLIDMQDPDCGCFASDQTELLDIIPNSGFEQHLGCCSTNMNGIDIYCITEWDILFASPDYQSVDCLSDDQIDDQFDFYGVVVDNGFVGSFVQYSHPSHVNGYMESMGVCFDEELTEGECYRMTFDVNLRSEVTRDAYISIFGSKSCDSITPGVEVNMRCSDDNYQEFGSINLADIMEEDKWFSQSIDFISEAGISAFFWDRSCNGLSDPSAGAYVYFDNFKLEKILPMDPTEDCTNGIDDDGDGLIDIFDDDCDCAFSSVVPDGNIVVNPGFDIVNDCDGFVFEGEDDVEGWFAVAGTPDFINLSCLDSEDLDLLEVTYLDTIDRNFIGFGTSSSGTEILANCLSSPIIKGSRYKVSLDIALADVSWQMYTGDFDLSFFGFTDCADNFLDLGGIPPCNYVEADGLYELHTFKAKDLKNKEITNLEFEILASEDLKSIFLSSTCGAGNSGSAYFIVSDLMVQPYVQSDLNITFSEACSNPLTAVVDTIDGASYQWYVDSIPVAGANSFDYTFTRSDHSPGDSIYVHVYADTICELLGPIEIPITELIVFDTVKIEMGDTYDFYGIELIEAGNYSANFNTASTCDSVLFLNLIVIDPLVVEICDNGEDDDGDGQIDIFDDDCDCVSADAGEGFVVNPSFDEYTYCQKVVTTNDDNVVGWRSVIGTPDFLHSDCYSAGELQEVQDTYLDVVDRNFIAFGIAGEYTELLTNCLTSPLVAGVNYRIETSMALPVQIFGLTKPHYISIYGYTECIDGIAPFGLGETICEKPFFNDLEELARLDVSTLKDKEITDQVFSFTAQSSIKAIYIASTCNVGNSLGPYVLLSDIQIYQERSEITFGDPCAEEIRASIDSAPGEEYQWYIDSIPVNGATFSDLLFSLSDIDEGDSLYVHAYTDESCVLVGPVGIPVPSLIETYDSLVICAGEDYSFGFQLVDSAGDFEETFVAVDGCDSISYLNVVVTPAPTSILTIEICAGEVYNFEGVMLTNSGEYSDTLTTVEGCDSIVDLTLIVHSEYESRDTIVVCGSEPIIYQGVFINGVADYTIPLYTVYGCDSTIYLAAVPKPDTVISIVETICEGDTFYLGGDPITESGFYTKSVVGIIYCDSLVNLTLDVIPYEIQTVEIPICPGSSFMWGNYVLMDPGIYFDTVKVAGDDCDYVERLIISTSDFIYVNLDREICKGESYDFYGREITLAGEYIDTVSSEVTCDSIVTLVLKVSEIEVTYEEYAMCPEEVLVIDGKSITESGEYTFTYQSIQGCDSLLELKVEWLPEQAKVDTLYIKIADGQSYTHALQSYDQDGTYDIFTSSIDGCDSLYILSLSVVDKTIIIPNVISPQSEVGNDILLISTEQDLMIKKYIVFDRWGNVMYQVSDFLTSDMDKYWRGTLGGKQVMDGVYIYKITFIDAFGKQQTVFGQVTVI